MKKILICPGCECEIIVERTLPIVRYCKRCQSKRKNHAATLQRQIDKSIVEPGIYWTPDATKCFTSHELKNALYDGEIEVGTVLEYEDETLHKVIKLHGRLQLRKTQTPRGIGAPWELQ